MTLFGLSGTITRSFFHLVFDGTYGFYRSSSECIASSGLEGFEKSRLEPISRNASVLQTLSWEYETKLPITSHQAAAFTGIGVQARCRPSWSALRILTKQRTTGWRSCTRMHDPNRFRALQPWQCSSNLMHSSTGISVTQSRAGLSRSRIRSRARLSERYLKWTRRTHKRLLMLQPHYLPSARPRCGIGRVCCIGGINWWWTIPRTSESR